MCERGGISPLYPPIFYIDIIIICKDNMLR
nr:MAG TPA: hypothetical protein [Caudoviricetes sp.]